MPPLCRTASLQWTRQPCRVHVRAIHAGSAGRTLSACIKRCRGVAYRSHAASVLQRGRSGPPCAVPAHGAPHRAWLGNGRPRAGLRQHCTRAVHTDCRPTCPAAATCTAGHTTACAEGAAGAATSPAQRTRSVRQQRTMRCSEQHSARGVHGHGSPHAECRRSCVCAYAHCMAGRVRGQRPHTRRGETVCTAHAFTGARAAQAAAPENHPPTRHAAQHSKPPRVHACTAAGGPVAPCAAWQGVRVYSLLMRPRARTLAAAKERHPTTAQPHTAMLGTGRRAALPSALRAHKHTKSVHKRLRPRPLNIVCRMSRGGSAHTAAVAARASPPRQPRMRMEGTHW